MGCCSLYCGSNKRPTDDNPDLLELLRKKGASESKLKCYHTKRERPEEEIRWNRNDGIVFLVLPVITRVIFLFVKVLHYVFASEGKEKILVLVRPLYVGFVINTYVPHRS